MLYDIKTEKEKNSMKVSVITVLDNTNFGTYLQALATCRAIEEVGHESEVVRYTRKFMTPSGMSRNILKERGLLRWINRRYLKPFKNIFRLRSQDYDFLAKYVSVTSEYIGYEHLHNTPPIADVYLTGSDQVWNSVYNRGIDKSYYLEFAPQGKKKIAYAASIGMSEIPTDQVDVIKHMLGKYSAITVRETSSVDLLSRIGIRSSVVLDPTLLLNREEWVKYADNSQTREEDYILTYSVEYGKENTIIEYYAKQVASRKKLKIYHVSYSGPSSMPAYADKVFPNATPDVFLRLMLGASFVIVSSFHGTAFAINFNKPFLTVSPHRFNSRIDSLLALTGLNSRKVSNCDMRIDDMECIDYEKVNMVLDHERRKSLLLLKSMIEQ